MQSKDDVCGQKKGTENRTAICLKSIQKNFGEKEVLKDISFSVEQGEIFGLLGPSGAGKTTLIKIMTGQLFFEGEACILDRDCKYQEKSRYEDIGILTDNCGLYERLSGYENLKIFAKIKGVKKERIEEVLKQVLLWDNRRVQVNRLSKGMKQRLLIARAILHRPKLLFLDEPTSGLDPTTAGEIHELLEGLRNEGVTIFLTTHNMSEASKLCRHLVLLHEGNIVEAGVPAEICLRHNLEQKIYLSLRDGTTVVFEDGIQEADTLCGYLKSGQIKAMHTSEPDLETVFRQLTGKELAV